MSRIVILGSGPSGLITFPNKSAEGVSCSAWFESLLQGNVVVFLPEIIDYELRRELIRAQKAKG